MVALDADYGRFGKKAVYVKALPESLWHAKQLQA
jgi:hypothetical protein